LSEKTEINRIRKQIEKVTLEIFNLCGDRFQLARQLGEIKATRGIPVENVKIEQELRSKVLELSKRQGMNEGFCLKLLQLLLEESKKIQNEIVKSQN